MAASVGGSQSQVSPSKERTTQWVCSLEIPSDLIVRIGDSIFPLHKAVMVPQSGYIRKKVAACADPSAAVQVDLTALPGGAEAFEKAARYCYGAGLEISARDAAAILCAAAHLDMTPAAEDGRGGGLARRAEEFLAQDALRTLPGAVAVLRSCEGLLPAAAAVEDVGVAQRAADAIALKICDEVLFPRSLPEWWAAELAALSPASFHRVVTALGFHRADPIVVATTAVAYAELSLAGGGTDPRPHRPLIESVAAALPAAQDAPLPVALLCRLLRAAAATGASAVTCLDLERRIAGVLDQATAGDLLAVAVDAAGERVTDVDRTRRIIAAFVEREAAARGGGGGPSSAALQKVARAVDEMAAEIATNEALPICKFVGIAGTVPKSARRVDDDLYRAVDIYLKAHPHLDEIEREKVCSVMDPLKLSYEARLHAAQNKRLPLQAVLSALYYDQLKLRGSAGGSDRTPATVARGQAKADASLARKNEALQSELVGMRAYLSNLEQGGSSGSKPTPAAKKITFFGWVSRTLNWLNPFKSISKDIPNIAEVGGEMSVAQVVKPKRRRFSTS